MINKKIIYIGNFSFPYGNASGSRVFGNGCLLRELGYEVYFLGLDNELLQDVHLSETLKEYDGFKYYNFPYPLGMKGWLSFRKRYKQAVELIQDLECSTVVLYGSPTISLFGNLLRKWCKKNSIILLADCVDWLSSGSGSFAYKLIKFVDNDYQKRILNSRTNGMIVISKYLSDFYQKKGVKTIILPPLIKRERYETLSSTISKSDKKYLIYIGQPFPTDGRKVQESSYKDRLDKVIELLGNLSSFDFVFDIYGITQHEYLSVIKNHDLVLDKLGEKIKFHGKIKNVLAIKKVAEADFTILFRDKNRMTSAGFPTKFVETISCGTPIITTNTSDLSDYLINGENGFFVNIDDQNLLKNKMKEILKLDRITVSNMKESCKKSSLFTHENYLDEMQKFMNSVT